MINQLIKRLCLSGGFMIASRFVAWMWGSSLMIFGAGLVSAQDYPSRPIRIVTSAPGGGTDFASRQIAPELASSLVSRQPLILVVHPSLPAKSIKELVALAKAKPGILNYSSAGTGSSGHL